jgi:hypothetical protein
MIRQSGRRFSLATNAKHLRDDHAQTTPAGNPGDSNHIQRASRISGKTERLISARRTSPKPRS